jgi:fructose-1,6-bisphosphatase I
MMYALGMTLTRFLIERQQGKDSSGELSVLLSQIATASKMVTNEMRRAGLLGILGYTGEVNVQGEAVRKLDELANSIFTGVMEYSRIVCEIVSEEIDGVTRVTRQCKGRKYSLLIDPLDGSSNIDINGTVGTIFSVTRRKDEMADETPEEDLLQKGSQQVAAGYVMYGPSTIFVFSSGSGVHGFTLDPGIGEFILSHDDMKIPQRGKIYAINYGNVSNWFPSTQKVVDYFSQTDPATGRPYSMRYVGSLVADFHRTLLEGGIYLYPADKKRANGKLRLLYECSPLAFLVEKAGGSATNGTDQILNIQPTDIHQRSPLIIGSSSEVATVLKFFQENS